MPIISSAKKKMRQDKKRTIQNQRVLEALKKSLKNARLAASAKNLKVAQSAIDTAVKKHLIHKNKAARLKSMVTKSKPKTNSSHPKTNQPGAENVKTTT